MLAAQSKTGWLVTLGQYIAWLIAALGAILDALYIREAFTALLAGLELIHNANYYRRGGIGIDIPFQFQLTLYDEVLIFVLSIAAVAAAVAIEYFFRKGRPKGLLLKRIGVVFGIEIAIIVVSILIRTII